MALFVIGALLIGTPAFALRTLCVGRGCESSASAAARTPFCSLPDQVRQSVAQGLREGRSGEIHVVARDGDISGYAGAGKASPVIWPDTQGVARVPIVLSGRGIQGGTTLPSDAGLDDIAPTLASVIGLDREHPEVRSGQPLEGALSGSGTPPKLLILVALKGVGSDTFDPTVWPNLNGVMQEGAAADGGLTLSSGADPVASMSTIGSGGSPAQHGMTSAIVRNDSGELVEAWGPDSPINVIATLGDDLDENNRDRATVALVGTQPGDLGLVGGRWYPGGDSDLVTILPERASARDVADQVSESLRISPLGNDAVPDLLGVALHGEPAEMDEALGAIRRAAEADTRGAVTWAIAGTGSAQRKAISAKELRQRLEARIPGRTPLIEALVPGSLFVDQEALADEEVSDDVVVRALLEMEAADDSPLFADVFPAVAVTLGRFC